MSFDNLNIKIKFRTKTKSKIWKEIADVRINDSIRGFFGSNNGFKDFSDTGYALGPDIPNVGNDTLNPRRQELLKYLLNKIRNEKFKQQLNSNTAKTFGDLIDEL